MPSSEDFAAMPPLKKALSTVMAFWLFPAVPVIAWLTDSQEGAGAVIFMAVFMYVLTGIVIGIPMLIIGLFTRRR
ncbi:MAG: hypothetical protein FNT29_09625 [Halothiobacillaceae bacterium]|nr:MAG: hypothetical protein FNT29_09625 [Halothiobacillaceae bacterium]